MAIAITPASQYSPFSQNDDLHFMALAQRLALKGLGRTGENPSVGAVIIDPLTQHILGAAYTAEGGRPHGEPQAIMQAGEKAKGAILYVTLEPCAHFGKTPPCADAIIKAGIERVVIGMLDPDPRTCGQGRDRLIAAGVKVDILPQKAASALQLSLLSHSHKILRNRPFITVKMAMSADGFIAAKQGKRVAISSPQTNAFTHLLRASHNGILVSGTTWNNDKPSLNVRLKGMEKYSPQPFILSQQAMDISTKSSNDAALSTIHLTATKGDKASLEAALNEIASTHNITRLLIETGAQLFAQMIAFSLADRVILYRSQTKEITQGVKAFTPDSDSNFMTLPHYINTNAFQRGEDDIRIFWHQRYQNLIENATLPYEEF